MSKNSKKNEQKANRKQRVADATFRDNQEAFERQRELFKEKVSAFSEQQRWGSGEIPARNYQIDGEYRYV